MAGKRRRVALLWAQFGAYHVDRCAAVANRLRDRAEVIAIEVASASSTYTWKPSQAFEYGGKRTLFPGRRYEEIGELRRFWAILRATWRADTILFGIGYDQPAIIVLSWLLRMLGKQVIAMSDSKFDDRNRGASLEWAKSLLLAPYSGAIVASGRSQAYFRFLGFRDRPVLPGYDVVSIDRVRADIAARAGEPVAFCDRHFTFVGRFIEKKNILFLIEGYAGYANAAGDCAQRIVIAGSGDLAQTIRDRAQQLGIAHLVELPGMLSSDDVSRLYASSLALILPSTSEQWGLVVNEAVAAGLPIIVSTNPGARDLLVRNLVNGLLVEPGSIPSMVKALTMIAGNEQAWQAMAQASTQRAWMGDVQVFAAAVESLVIGPTPDTDALLQTIQAELDAATPRQDVLID